MDPRDLRIATYEITYVNEETDRIERAVIGAGYRPEMNELPALPALPRLPERPN